MGPTDRPIAEMDGDALLEFVREKELDEVELLQVLRSPFCSVQVAELVASDRGLLGSHGVRERLAGFPGFSFARAVGFLSTLPWASLLTLAQAPKTPPVIRRQAERKLLEQLPTMALGEKIALARRTHRALLGTLIAIADGQVLSAVLNNPRLVENDILIILNTTEPSPDFFAELARHHRWGQYPNIRRALVECPRTPLPLALSVLVQLPLAELSRVLSRPDLSEKVRDASKALLEKESKGLRRRMMVRSSGDVGDGGAAQPPENFR
ncbi:MAG: hypothetical protein ACC742_01280 [Thermoanaerobaculales bacterium]